MLCNTTQSANQRVMLAQQQRNERERKLSEERKEANRNAAQAELYLQVRP